jgi:class 3 adenylate cyclase/pimeloyl-ACP methyl ester carboxylesterase
VRPRTRYATSGELSIAFQVHGDGPVDLLFVPTFLSHLEHLWEEPAVVRWRDRLAEIARLIFMDRRGAGLSDIPPGEWSLVDELADVEAVLDAAASDRPALMGYIGGAQLAATWAARRPERTRALVLYAPMIASVRDDDLPWLQTEAERDARFEELLASWGQGGNMDLLAPSAADDLRLRSWVGRLERVAASPGRFRRLTEMVARHDPRPELAKVQAPTLVVRREGDTFIDRRHALYYADHIPGARFVELPGVDNLMFAGDVEPLVGEIEEHLTGERHAGMDRALLTVLFTDICDGTKKAAEVGDARWRDLLAGHDRVVRRELERYAGREVKTVGDGFLAVFSGAPSQAVRCARAVVGAAAALGIEVRAGLHTGECELIGDDVGGMAVHIAARVSALAGPREVLASGTTFGTVVGSGLEWEDRGARQLKGVPGAWPLFALT